jgi:ribosomal protein L37E
MTKIKCTACGEYINGELKDCTNCGYPINQYIADIDCNEEENKEGEDLEVQNQIRKFNWGAFLLSPVWVFGNGMAWLFLIYLVNWAIRVFSLIMLYENYSYEYTVFFFASFVLNIVLTIYLGIRGSALAWEKKEWQSIQHFAHVQKKWAKWGIIIWAAYIALVVILGVSALFVRNLI